MTSPEGCEGSSVTTILSKAMSLHVHTGIAAAAAVVWAMGLTAIQEQQRESFRTAVDLVELDVIATDREGRPILDLSPTELEIFEDDRLVEVASFRPVRLQSPAATVAASTDVHRGAVWATNDRASDGRLVVIVLDTVDRSRFHNVRRTVLALLDQLGPTDQIAMLSNGGSSEYHVEFTRDHSRVARALDSRGTLGGSPDRLLRVLTRVADALRGVQGRRKIVALVSEGIPEIARSLDVFTENQVPELHQFLSAALRANVSVYSFNPRYAFDVDKTTQAESVTERALQVQDERDGTTGLQTIAEATGGRATARTGTFDSAVKRMLSESGSYYLVAYRSNAARDGRFHRVSLRSRRPGVELRTRSGYVLPKLLSPVEAAVASVDRLVSAPIDSNSLPFRFVAVASPSRGQRSSGVHLMVEIEGTHTVASGNTVVLGCCGVFPDALMASCGAFAVLMPSSRGPSRSATWGWWSWMISSDISRTRRRAVR
jgi:VWFA-related protein